MVTTSRLCEFCKGIDIRLLLLAAERSPSKPNNGPTGSLHSSKRGVIYQAVPKFYQHRPNLLSLKEAIDGCDLCSSIWKEYSRHRQSIELTDTAISQGTGNEIIYIGTLDWDTGINAVPHVSVIQTGPPPHNMQRQLACFEVCAEYDRLPRHSSHLLARLQAHNAASPQCFKLAEKWLKQCCNVHADCKRNNGNLRLPTRLLAVGDDGDEESKVRLVRGDECDGPYAALSYCWGPDRDLILTHDTYESLQDGVLISGMPGTLKDAVTVTRKLKIPYIWIDALCIFQDQEREDSKQDWVREAARMRDVYRGATVTIEAASATRGSEGFLVERPSSRPYCELEWSEEPEFTYVYLRPIVDITDNQLLGAKIFSRGWTLQERLLAPRTLSFGKQQISFECANGFVDEAGRSTLLPRVTESYLSKQSMLTMRKDRGSMTQAWRSLSRRLPLPPSVTLSQTHNIGWSSNGKLSVPGGYWATYNHYWRSIVGQFTGRQLTNPSDRLPALSGLADEFCRATGDRYIAGMWAEELLLDLAWKCQGLYNPNGEYGNYSGGIPANNFVTGPYPQSLKSSNYVAPSWSWSSVQGKVSFVLGNYHVDRKIKQHAKVIDVHVEPKYSSDPLGSLSGGHLVLSAPLLLIPDPQVQCPGDCEIKTLHEENLRKAIRKSESWASEFWQHHEHHSGQQFGLVKLFHEITKSGQASSLLELLMVESCESGGWRRVCGVNVSLSTLDQLETEFFKNSDVNDPRDKEYMDHMRPELLKMANITKEVDKAPWKTKNVTLY